MEGKLLCPTSVPASPRRVLVRGDGTFLYTAEMDTCWTEALLNTFPRKGTIHFSRRRVTAHFTRIFMRKLEVGAPFFQCVRQRKHFLHGHVKRPNCVSKSWNNSNRFLCSLTGVPVWLQLSSGLSGFIPKLLHPPLYLGWGSLDTSLSSCLGTTPHHTRTHTCADLRGQLTGQLRLQKRVSQEKLSQVAWPFPP